MRNEDQGVSEFVQDVRWAREVFHRINLTDDALRGLLALNSYTPEPDADTLTLRRRVIVLDETLAEWKKAGVNEYEIENAGSCLDDALCCFYNHVRGIRFPGLGTHPSLPRTYLASADRWVQRAGQHAYGSRLPELWFGHARSADA